MKYLKNKIQRELILHTITELERATLQSIESFYSVHYRINNYVLYIKLYSPEQSDVVYK